MKKSILMTVIIFGIILFGGVSVRFAFAAQLGEIMVDVNQKIISANGDTSFFTNAEIDKYGLCTIGVDEDGNASYEKSFLRIDVNANIERNENVKIDVEYRDSYPRAWFTVKYKTINGEIKYAEMVSHIDTDKYVTHTFTLPDAVFDNSFNGYDFEVVSYRSPAKYEYSTKASHIKSVSVHTDDTYSSIVANVNSKRIGNIFYTSDMPMFDIEYSNIGESSEISRTFTVYKYNEKTNEKELYKTDVRDLIIEERETKKEKLEFEVNEYGKYCLELLIDGRDQSGHRIYVNKSYDFSKCILNDTLNKKLGVAAHIANGRGNALTAYELMKNAGIGIVREGLYSSWNKESIYNPSLSIRQGTSIAQKNGIDSIVSFLYTDGSNSLPGADEITLKKIYDNTYSFVTNEIMSKNIDMLSIGNEPEFTLLLDGVNIAENSDKFSLLGKRYGIIASAAAKAVKDSGTTIKLGAFESNLVYWNFTDKNLFIKENIKIFMESALTEMQKNDVLGIFDAYVCHPYMGNNSPEDYNGMVNYIKAILDRFNYGNGNYEIWATEMGWSSAQEHGSLLKRGSEYEVAKYNLRQFINMLAESSNGRYCFYDFIDDGVIESNCESNFGMLNCYKWTDVPYSAKYSYLAVSAFNRIVGDASCEKLNMGNEDVSCFVAKNENNTVYCLWKNSHGETSIPDMLGTTEAEIFDLFGNYLPDVTEDGIIHITDSPIYVVKGLGIKAAVANTNSIITVSGNIGSKLEGQNISMIVVDSEKFIDDIDIKDELIYFTQGVTGENGKFSFEVSLDGTKIDCKSYIFTDNEQPLELDFSGLSDDYIINLRDGITCIDRLEMGFDLKNASIGIKFNSSLKGNQKYCLICTIMNGDFIVDVKAFSGEKAVGDEMTENFDMSYSFAEETIQFDKVKLFLWEDSNCIPLCDVKIIN